MAEAIVMSLLVLDIGIVWALIESMVKPSQLPQPDHLADDQAGIPGWEYKIVRARGRGFRSWRAMQYVCAQEAKFGWSLLEKLDDSHLRLRRPIAARGKDSLIKQNPYRTEYGISAEFETLLSLVATLIILVIPAYVGYGFMRNIFRELDVKTPRQITPPKPLSPAKT